MSTKSFFIGGEINVPEPSERDSKAKNIIEWGSNNLYPQFLNGLYYNSAINGGIINSKVHYTTSGGLNYEGSDQERYDLFFNNGNSDFDLNEIAEQASLDLEIYEAFCLKGVWNLDKSRVEKIELIDFEKIRYHLDGESIVVSNDWSNKKESVKIIKPFSPSDRKDREFYVIYKPNSKQTITGNKINAGTYPRPKYSGAINSLLTDQKITKYHLNEISNGFSSGTALNLNNGKPTGDGEAEALERDIKKRSTGEDNAGRVLVFYNNGKDREASVLNLTGNDLNDRYLALSKDVRDNIVLSHSVTAPILFGVKTEGALGNATELEMGYKIMNANYFKYRRRAIASALNYIAQKGNGLTGKIGFNDVHLELEAPKEEAPKDKQEKEINIVDLFNQTGNSREGKTVLFTQSLPNEFNIEEENKKIIENFQKDSFRNLSSVEYQVLNLLKEGNKFDTIRRALGIKPFKLTRIYRFLRRSELITKGGEVTTNGSKSIAQQDLTKIEIYYSYAINPTIGGADIIPTTRDFCRTLVNMSNSKVWSREDIDFISGKLGYNAFSYRGGWYHNPKTEVNTPWCRHLWTQEIVYK